MLGAIAGDIIGSVYEGSGFKSKDFPLFGNDCSFTDDTVCTVAVADCLINDGDFGAYLRQYVRDHPHRGYGGMFREWAFSNMGPYNSWGNGGAMRVSPVAYAARDLDEALTLAEKASEVTHNHPSAVTGAQAVTLVMWLARHGADATTIRAEVEDRFGYDLSRCVDEIRLEHEFDISSAGTVPPSIVCALEATDYEDAVRNAVSLGGDADTIACITGGIAQVMFGLPESIAVTARGFLTDDLIAVVDRFMEAAA